MRTSTRNDATTKMTTYWSALLLLAAAAALPAHASLDQDVVRIVQREAQRLRLQRGLAGLPGFGAISDAVDAVESAVPGEVPAPPAPEVPAGVPAPPAPAASVEEDEAQPQPQPQPPAGGPAPSECSDACGTCTLDLLSMLPSKLLSRITLDKVPVAGSILSNLPGVGDLTGSLNLPANLPTDIVVPKIVCDLKVFLGHVYKGAKKLAKEAVACNQLGFLNKLIK